MAILKLGAFSVKKKIEIRSKTYGNTRFLKEKSFQNRPHTLPEIRKLMIQEFLIILRDMCERAVCTKFYQINKK